MKSYKKQVISSSNKYLFFISAKMTFWFFFGVFLGLFFLSSFLFIYYQQTYKNTIYPGVFVNGIEFGGKSKEEVKNYFIEKNNTLTDVRFTFTTEELSATASAKDLGIGYDEELLSNQAYSIGRSKDSLSNITLMVQAYFSGIMLPSSYKLEDEKLKEVITPIEKAVTRPPQDALFSFENGRVTAFQTALNGQAVDKEELKKMLVAKSIESMTQQSARNVTVAIPVKTTEPEITNQEANDLGIQELVATGTSLFYGSIENRIFNLTHASSKLNGVLIKPGEVFSFNKTVGDISTATGFKQAYVIQNGKTVLGDGGGVCQVSTTLFRAALHAGLPIIERNPHAYRVHYYEDDVGPGIDAAIYHPTVDLQFKNDTGHHLLIQTSVDREQYKLTFNLYGTKDAREVVIGKPVITSQSPAPEPLYQDDPNLAKGQVKQVDWAAPGARVNFTRKVTKNGKVIADDTFYSNYRPWQAVYLKGTKEG